METVRNYLAGSLARSLDGVLNRHDRLMTLHGLGMPADYLTQYHQHLFSVNPDQVRRSAERYLNPETWICASAG
jgi:predicted Zn-dependent peptidase